MIKHWLIFILSCFVSIQTQSKHLPRPIKKRKHVHFIETKHGKHFKTIGLSWCAKRTVPTQGAQYNVLDYLNQT